MTRDEMFSGLVSLLRQNRCRLETIGTGTSIQALGLDSVRLTACLMELEELFKVLVPDQEWGKWNTLGDILDYIEEYLAHSVGINPIDIDLVGRRLDEGDTEKDSQ
ncbi:phosphopantetheine-binding protein [bacterium]|nr:phosphopantetheine-binding protein [bacterium]